MPREVLSVLVEEIDGSVIVTWGLGSVVPRAFEYFGYVVYYYGTDGNGGKRFAVRFAAKTTAYVWDNASNTQANYDGDIVAQTSSSIVVRYHDADLGLKDFGTIGAFSHIDEQDAQLEIPVTLLR